MSMNVIVRSGAAVALVACTAGLAVGAKYNPAPQGAPTRVTDAANAAGTLSLTRSATKLYGTGGAYSNVKLTAPILQDRLDGFFNNAVAEVVGGVAKCMNTTFCDVFVNPPNTTADQEKIANHWGLAQFNVVAVGTATGNDVLIDESITPVEIAQNPTVVYNTNNRDWSDSMGSLLPDGTALWRANFNSARSPSHNNVETLNVAGAIGAAVSAGNKIYLAGNQIDLVGAGSAFMSMPSGARLNDGRLIVGATSFGSGSAKNGFIANIYDGTRQSWTLPPYRWLVANYPLIADTAGNYPTDAELRTSSHRVSKLSRAGCSTETVYATFGQGSVTAANTLPPNNHLFTGGGFGPRVIFVDTVDFTTAQNLNGFTNGFAFVSADPAATYNPAGAGGRGTIGPINPTYRFIEIQGTGSNGFAQHDINSKGQVVALWADFTDTANPVYRINRYDPVFDTVDACKIVGYSAPVIIAESNVDYGGTTFITSTDSFISGTCPTETLGVQLQQPFSGVSIDDEGNISFVATVESFEVTVNYVDCNSIPLGTAPDVRSSTSALCFYEASTQSLYRIADGGQNGDVLTDGAGLQFKVGRMPSTNDSDAYGAEGMSESGRVFAFTARNGSDEGNTDSNTDGFNQDGGTLRPGTANETSVRATIMVELGAQTPSCPCFFDLNGDCIVNTADLAAFLGQFGKTCAQIAPARCADSNNDGVVNTADLAAFLGQFGKQGISNPSICQ